MNRVTFSVVAIMLLAAATTLPFVLNAGFGKAPQGAQLSQVEASWKYIHMMPDETAQAADDLRARAVLPGHAGRFVLAKHSWDEPYQRLAAASEGRAWRLLTPVQGEPVWVADKTQSFNAWWR